MQVLYCSVFNCYILPRYLVPFVFAKHVKHPFQKLLRGTWLFHQFFFFNSEFCKDKSKNGIKEKFFHLKTSLVGGSVLFGFIQICGLAMFGLLGFKISPL